MRKPCFQRLFLYFLIITDLSEIRKRSFLKLFRQMRINYYIRGGIIFKAMKDRIIGREREKVVLTSLYQSNNAEFLAVYGRRRVGKTYLVREFFEDTFAFYHTALSPFELKDQPKLLYRAQLDEFAHSLKKYGETKDDPIENWFEAFHRNHCWMERRGGRGWWFS